MQLSDLQTKDVVNIIDGRNLGRIIDAELNTDGVIEYFVVEKRRLFRRLFSNNDITVTIKQIKKIGSDVIIVEVV